MAKKGTQPMKDTETTPETKALKAEFVTYDSTGTKPGDFLSKIQHEVKDQNILIIIPLPSSNPENGLYSSQVINSMESIGWTFLEKETVALRQSKPAQLEDHYLFTK